MAHGRSFYFECHLSGQDSYPLLREISFLPHQARVVLLWKEFPPTGKKKSLGRTHTAGFKSSHSDHTPPEHVPTEALEFVLEELHVTLAAFITRYQIMTQGCPLRN